MHDRIYDKIKYWTNKIIERKHYLLTSPYWADTVYVNGADHVFANDITLNYYYSKADVAAYNLKHKKFYDSNCC
jgi:hypothetical protein